MLTPSSAPIATPPPRVLPRAQLLHRRLRRGPLSCSRCSRAAGAALRPLPLQRLRHDPACLHSRKLQQRRAVLLRRHPLDRIDRHRFGALLITVGEQAVGRPAHVAAFVQHDDLELDDQ
eukprot:6198345-Pleurochrysis_carterae.AAC.1